MIFFPKKRKTPNWKQLASGLYVPPLIGWAGARRFAPGYPCCCEGRPCEFCTDDLPQAYRVTIAGIAEPSCGDCDSLNGVYDIDIEPGNRSIATATVKCGGAIEMDTLCQIGMIRISWDVLVFADFTVDLRGPSGVGTRIVWGKDYETPPNCNFEDEALPRLSENAFWNCDGSASTAIVTSI